MKEQLIQLARLELTDAEIETEIDADVPKLEIKFRAAFDVELRAHVDGNIRLSGWEAAWLDDRPIELHRNEVAIFDWVAYQHTFGDILTFTGSSSEILWGEWSFKAVENLEVEIDQRATRSGKDFDRVEPNTSVETSHASEKCALRRVMVEVRSEDYNSLERAYAQLCWADARRSGEAPFIPRVLELHLVDGGLSDSASTQFDESREAWEQKSDAVVVYTDFGTTERMNGRLIEASRRGRPVEYRRLFELDEARAFLEAQRRGPDASG